MEVGIRSQHLVGKLVQPSHVASFPKVPGGLDDVDTHAPGDGKKRAPVVLSRFHEPRRDRAV
jgi:hypothetical protein